MEVLAVNSMLMCSLILHAEHTLATEWRWGTRAFD